jgi:threonine dehydratase/serine racemase
MKEFSVDFSDIESAADRIAGVAHCTPVVTCATLDKLTGRHLFFKCENYQKVGAFKFRGAFNAVQKLSEAEASKGVVTHSSGNHAQALALAAQMRGIPAHIIMPSSASPVKKAAVQDYGANVVVCEPTLEARETTAKSVQQETGATFIHPYDNDDIIAGQGTAMLELHDQMRSIGQTLDTVITPVGGGGLLSGTAIAARELDSSIRILAAEPSGADDAARSMAAGRWIAQESPNTIADGLLTSTGERTWPIIQNCVEQIITVTDAEIVVAMRLLWERAKLLIEPSSAVVLAAVMKDEFPATDSANSIGLILSGGNVNLDKLPW